MRQSVVILALCLSIGLHSACADPTTKPTTSATTGPSIKPIELRFGAYQARIEIRTTISREGLLHSVRIDDKSYGPNDMDPKYERTEVREGKLTSEQMTRLAALLDGWDTLSPGPYTGVTDGPELSLRYGNKTISGGSAVPHQVIDAQLEIFKLTETMPIVKQ